MPASVSSLSIVCDIMMTYAVNRAGSMHGGVVMTLIDSGGSLAVATNGYRNTGVSTDINATFARPAGKAGDVIRVTSEIISMGKPLAYSRTELRDVDSNELLGVSACISQRSLWKSYEVFPYGVKPHGYPNVR